MTADKSFHKIRIIGKSISAHFQKLTCNLSNFWTMNASSKWENDVEDVRIFLLLAFISILAKNERGCE